MNPRREHAASLTRRQFFGRAAPGIGAAALASLLGRRSSRSGAAEPQPGLPGLPHFAPKAKRVIYLFQSGAPSQIDLFDYKPKLDEAARQRAARLDPQGPAAHRDDLRPEAASRSRRRCSSSRSTASAGRGSANCCRTRRRSPTTSASSRSMHTEAINHDPAITFFQTGVQLAGPAEHRLVAVATAWAARTRTCRRSS